MNIVFIIPTGLGFDLGGHAGDANPAVKCFAGLADKLITHPNAVNASEINEMPENTLYVEGSILDDFLDGTINLKEVKAYNKILCVANKPLSPTLINCVNAARLTIGADIELLELNTPLRMIAGFDSDGKAGGEIHGIEELLTQVEGKVFDALAVVTPIDSSKESFYEYCKEGGVNPVGGVEAIASRRIAEAIRKPTAHAPIILEEEFMEFAVDPRMAAEAITSNYAHCLFKGLHRAPRVERDYTRGINNKDVDILISPAGVWGRPHEACWRNHIPIIFVKSNRPLLKHKDISGAHGIVVENYVEAAGVVACMKAGVDYKTILRPYK